MGVMEDQQGFELLNQSTVSIEYPNIMSNRHNISCRLSFSKLEVALMIAVVIFAILSMVFMAMYFTPDGNPCRHQNSRQKNKGNESKNCTVKCSANRTKPHNSGTG